MKSALLGIMTFAICCASGCSSQAPAMPSRVLCKGTALLPNGEPLRSVRLVFHPDKALGIPLEGMADTDAKGQFEVTSITKGDGIVPGNYIVTIEPFDFNKASPTKNKAMAALIPKKYDETASSDIKIEVTSEQSDLQIRLKP